MVVKCSLPPCLYSAPTLTLKKVCNILFSYWNFQLNNFQNSIIGLISYGTYWGFHIKVTNIFFQELVFALSWQVFLSISSLSIGRTSPGSSRCSQVLKTISSNYVCNRFTPRNLHWPFPILFTNIIVSSIHRVLLYSM